MLGVWLRKLFSIFILCICAFVTKIKTKVQLIASCEKKFLWNYSINFAYNFILYKILTFKDYWNGSPWKNMHLNFNMMRGIKRQRIQTSDINKNLYISYINHVYFHFYVCSLFRSTTEKKFRSTTEKKW